MPGQFEHILSRITYKDWKIRQGKLGNGIFIQCVFNALDVDTNEVSEQRGRKWYISPFACETEIVRTVYLAIRGAEEHEVQENFRYLGNLIFNPHTSVHSLCAASTNLDVRIERTFP